MNTLKTLVATGTAFFTTASLGHSGAELTVLAPGALLSGLMHPFTGIDHMLTLLLLGGAIVLLHSGQDQQLKRRLSGAVMLGVLLGWSFLHYSGEYFATYALGFSISSTLLISAGAQVTSIGKRFKAARCPRKK